MKASHLVASGQSSQYITLRLFASSSQGAKDSLCKATNSILEWESVHIPCQRHRGESYLQSGTCASMHWEASHTHLYILTGTA